jgi:hypothetical protein
MPTALILICSLATAAPDLGDCTRDNAVDVVYVPATFASPANCLMHGQAYLAGSEMGRNLARNEVVKVVCVRSPSDRIDKAESGGGRRVGVGTMMNRSCGRADHTLCIRQPGSARWAWCRWPPQRLGARQSRPASG